jgi:hypothetical protein
VAFLCGNLADWQGRNLFERKSVVTVKPFVFGWRNAKEDQSGSSRIYPGQPLKGFALFVLLKSFGATPNPVGEYANPVRFVKKKAQPVDDARR